MRCALQYSIIQIKNNIYYEVYRINIIQWIYHTIRYIFYNKIYITDTDRYIFFLNNDILWVYIQKF